VFNPANSNVAYGGGAYFNTDEFEMSVYKTINGWSSWTRSTLRDSGYVQTMALHPLYPETVYAGGYSFDDQLYIHPVLFKSTNGGTHWTDMSGYFESRRMNGQVTTIAIDPTDPNVLYIGGYFDYSYIYKSTDGGSSWADISGSIRNGTTAIAIDPTSTNTLYASTWGGVYESTNGGSSWLVMDEGLAIDDVPIDDITKVAIDPQQTERLYVGTYGGGVFRVPGVAVENQEPSSLIPSVFALAQNYPNPFNPITTIQYSVKGDQSSPYVSLKIFNLLGQQVRTLVDGDRDSGYYSVTWDGRDDRGREVPSGVYFYRLIAGTFSGTKKMVLMK
jgi:hypothetical protein